MNHSASEAALLDAASDGDYETVRRLTTHPVNLEVRDKLGMTPLILAAWKRHQSVVELLLQRGSDINATTATGCNVIHWAAATSNSIVELLVARGADINVQDDFMGETPLSSIAVRGEEWADVVDFLMKCGADPEIENKYGMTAARWAAGKDHFKILCALLDNGAKITNEVTDGSPALHLASARGHERVVKRILEIPEVDINVVDKYGYTPLLWAVQKGKPAIVKILLDNGANVDAKLPDEKTAFDLAREGGYQDIVSILNRRPTAKARSPATFLLVDRSVENDRQKQIQDAQQLKIMALEKEGESKKKEAEILLRQAVDIYERVLGLEDTTTLTTMDLYSKFLRNREAYDEAEKIHWKMWKGSEKLQGSDDEATITCMFNLAKMLGYQKKYEEAEQLHRQTLHKMERVYGPNHTTTETNIKALAETLMKLNKKVEAANLLLRACIGKLELENPDILKDIHHVVQLLREQGRYWQVEVMLKYALARREEKFGSGSSSAREVSKDLVRVLLDQKKYKEAEKIQRDSLFKVQDKVGKLDPDTKEDEWVLGAILALEGSYYAAEKTLVAALNLKDNAFENETLACRRTMIRLLAMLILSETDWDNVDGKAVGVGKLDEVEKIYRRALKGKEKA